MNIYITGQSGFLGTYLTQTLQSDNHEIIEYSREDLYSPDILKDKIDKADVIINLAGATIIKRWTEEYKKEIYNSRINTTNSIIDILSQVNSSEKILISASASGIYSSREIHDEGSNNFDTGFLGKLASDWENSVLEAEKYGTRVIVLRFPIILGKNGGALKKMLLPFKLGLGGRLGDGEQYFPWVHIDDIGEILKLAITDENINGIYNVSAPEVITNNKFTKTLAKVLHRPAIFPVPPFALKLLYGEGATVLLEGAGMIPKRLYKYGYDFKYKRLEDALREILK